MPTDKNTTAENKGDEIERVSVEGRPAEPRRSPHGIVLRIAGLVALTATVAALSGIFIGAPAAVVAVLLVVAAAVIFNPEIWSTKGRLKDRQEVAEAH